MVAWVADGCVYIYWGVEVGGGGDGGDGVCRVAMCMCVC